MVIIMTETPYDPQGGAAKNRPPDVVTASGAETAPLPRAGDGVAAGVAMLLGIPVYARMRNQMTEPEPVPEYR
jgi:hypothetical protein